MWAMISWPFSRRTRNMVFGRVSATVPSNSITSSFAMRFLGSTKRRASTPAKPRILPQKRRGDTAFGQPGPRMFMRPPVGGFEGRIRPARLYGGSGEFPGVQVPERRGPGALHAGALAQPGDPFDKAGPGPG